MSNDSEELTVESLQKKREDFLTHGLSDTALGDAMERQADETIDEFTKHQQIVEAKVTLAQAEQAGVDDDPSVEALRETVNDLSEETEAAALVEHSEKAEAREMISHLKNMKESARAKGVDSLVDKYTEKIEAVRREHA